LNLTWISSQSPSAADPWVVDLRAARVEPDHRSSACGRTLDLAGAPLVDLTVGESTTVVIPHMAKFLDLLRGSYRKMT
jgi:hypothetical protein